jgi:hypothetical protein
METAKKKKMFKHKSKSVIDEDNFDRFKNPLTVIVNPGSLIIPSEALWKFYWDLFITVLLMTICTVMPAHLAF